MGIEWSEGLFNYLKKSKTRRNGPDHLLSVRKPPRKLRRQSCSFNLSLTPLDIIFHSEKTYGAINAIVNEE